MSLGAVVTHTREELALSQKDVADAARVSPQYINDIERERRQPRTRDLLERLAAALRLPPEYLFYQAGLLPDAGEPHDVPPDFVVRAYQAFEREIRLGRDHWDGAPS